MLTEVQLVGPYERLVLLKALLMSGHPPAEALSALAHQAGELRLAAGARITATDSAWERAYVVVEGRVGLYQDGQLLYSAGPTEPFALLEMFARVQGGIEVRAEVETLALELRASTLLSVLEDHFIMTLDTVRILGRMLLTTPVWLSGSMAIRRFVVPEVVPAEGIDLVDRIRMLRASDVFARTRLDSIAEVADQFEEFRVGAGAVLWQEDEFSDWLMVLLDGRIASASKQGLRFEWSPGTVPGLIDALVAAPRWHDAIAATPVTGLRLSAERFLDAMEDDFEMATDVLASVAARVRQQRLALASTLRLGPDKRD